MLKQIYRQIIMLLMGAILITGCELTGGGKVSLLNSDQRGEEEKVSTDLDLVDFKEMAAEVSREMLADARLFDRQDNYKLSIGAVRNLTENERLRVSDIVGLIRESLLQDERIRIFNTGESFYVVHTELKSAVSSGSEGKIVDYELRFELYNFDTEEYLGSWSAHKSYKQTARSLF